MSAYTCEQRATLRLNLPYVRASRLPNLRRIFSLVFGLRNSKNACVYGHMMGASLLGCYLQVRNLTYVVHILSAPRRRRCSIFSYIVASSRRFTCSGIRVYRLRCNEYPQCACCVLTWKNEHIRIIPLTTAPRRKADR
jgi:hypothetical protein